MEKKQISIVFNPHNMQINRARKSSEHTKKDMVYHDSAKKIANIMALVKKSSIKRVHSESTDYEKCRDFDM